jgi:N-glycosylase/DNA lyase
VHFISGGEYAIVKDGEIISTDDGYFSNYFNLAQDYQSIEKTLKLPQKVKEPCKGIRILSGDIIEIILSFIISANNNIGRIKKTILRLCENYGEKREFSGIKYSAFPHLQNLSKITESEFRSLGCGYRSAYLEKTVAVLQNMNLPELQKLNNDELYKQLTALCGVGDKVARCIMLFAFHRLDIVPVDTWIIKTAGKFVGTQSKTPKTVAVALQEYFGQYGGIAQQYIFYYTQNLKNAI